MTADISIAPTITGRFMMLNIECSLDENRGRRAACLIAEAVLPRYLSGTVYCAWVSGGREDSTCMSIIKSTRCSN